VSSDAASQAVLDDRWCAIDQETPVCAMTDLLWSTELCFRGNIDMDWSTFPKGVVAEDSKASRHAAIWRGEPWRTRGQLYDTM
jgi:hypothetical protein